MCSARIEKERERERENQRERGRGEGGGGGGGSDNSYLAIIFPFRSCVPDCCVSKLVSANPHRPWLYVLLGCRYLEPRLNAREMPVIVLHTESRRPDTGMFDTFQ